MKAKLLFVILLAASGLFAQKIILQKSENYQKKKAKLHPYTHLLKQGNQEIAIKRDNSNRLLVILVDFQEDTDSNTTGNGKFLLEPDPNWKTTIGSPPHNQEYFRANLDAVKYYYKAVSNESFSLEYEIWPNDKAAYTLPQTIGYYNPPEASGEVFVQKMEEYFKSAFEIADQEDPEIDFSSFQHFMIIHAGSDWQHDVNGDSPSDIPSFFIKVVEGKEAVVEGGNVRISHACNVPAMISQDFDSFTDSGQVVHTGYGALNAVITHEFGHSLGLVDLYNTFNSQPMVGVFDIMDSGGSGIMVDQNNDGEWIFVEGALPALPGAFSRILIFGDYYKQNGYLKELHELPFDTDIQLAASSHKQTSANLIPSILKIPLSPTEYILVENRSVDPDRDGGTAVWSDLNRRVAVYPTAIEDPNNIPTYEYDYLLPSFVNVDNESFGGGVLVWHVDENIIYNEGTVGSDGVFYSNYENNSVNTSYRRRGVKIIEADNLPDLGNVYSYYWTGTPYEYFHKNKPNLDSHGLFLNWSLQPWNNKLDALSKPALMDNSGTPCFYGVKDIGIPSAIMNLKIGSAFFDNTQTINLSSPIRSSAFPIGSSFTNLPELPLFTDNELVLFTHQIQPGFPDWTNQLGEFDYHWQVPDYPTSISDLNQNGYSEIMLTRDDTINLLEFANDSFTVKSISCEQPFVTPPLFLNGSLWAATADKLYQYTDQDEQEYLFSGVQALLGFQDQLYILRENQLLTYSGSGDFQTLSNLPEKFGVYEPIIFVDQNSSDAIMVFLVSDNGNIYKYIPGKLELIFQNRETVLPTQLGIMSFGETSPVLFFGLGEHVFALKHDGTSLPMFPGLISAQASKPQAHPKALKLSDTNIMLIPTQQGYLAFDQNARLLPGFSLVWDEDGGENYFYWEEQSQNLYWYNIPNSGQVLIHKLGGQSENPIVYQGFRNAGTGTVIAPLTDPDPIDENFTAYIYPNPIKSGHFRIRLENSRGDAKVNIYSISGALVHSESFPDSGLSSRDLQMNSFKLNSGVYIAVVEAKGKSKRLRFAIQK